jgi:hypothetical protein
LVKIVVPFEYVPPVTLMSVGKPRYVLALNVLADNPFVKIVGPFTVPPLKSPPPVLNPVTLNVPPVLFTKVAVPAL